MMAKQSARHSRLCRWLIVCLWAVGWSTVAGADVLRDIVARSPAQPRSFNQVVAHLEQLSASERCTVYQIGSSRQGRPLLLAEITDPGSPFRRTTLLIIARQHGNEPAGTEAALALAEHFTLAPTADDAAIMRHLRLLIIPVANPDGAVANRRSNSGGVDLNRDWARLTQPETRAIDQTARQVRPDAIMDLHELPASSSNPAYQTNFIQTLGSGPRIPTDLSRLTRQISAGVSSWMRTYGYPLNVYYDGGGSLDLCHRYFGLHQQFPTFLVESKTGGGRTLRDRVGFHVLSMLVVANHLMHGSAAPPASETAPVAEVKPPTERAETAPPAVPPSLQVAFRPSAEPERGEVHAVYEGDLSPDYLELAVGGQTRALSNLAEIYWALDLTTLEPGEHELTVTAYGAGAGELAAAHLTLVVGAEQTVAAR